MNFSVQITSVFRIWERFLFIICSIFTDYLLYLLPKEVKFFVKIASFAYGSYRDVRD